MPDDPPSRFLDLTEAAQLVYEALTTLREETGHYSEASNRLDAASENTRALCEATSRVIEEQTQRWEELKKMFAENVAPPLARLSESADKQTVLLSSLSASVAGQQSQLVQLQQSTDTVVKSNEQQHTLLVSLADAIGGQGTVLREHSNTLQEHSEQLAGTREDLRDQRTTIRELVRTAKRALYAALAAGLFALVAVVLLLVR